MRFGEDRSRLESVCPLSRHANRSLRRDYVAIPSATPKSDALASHDPPRSRVRCILLSASSRLSRHSIRSGGLFYMTFFGTSNNMVGPAMSHVLTL